MPLPEEPEEQSTFQPACKFNEAFRGTPPPPYYPSRFQLSMQNSLKKISIPSISSDHDSLSRHNYENDGYSECQSASNNCYFIPLNDEDAAMKKEEGKDEEYLVPATSLQAVCEKEEADNFYELENKS